MLLNPIKVAVRNFTRQASFSGIHVTGLAVGLAACWQIALFVLHEKGYDDFVPDHDRILAAAADRFPGVGRHVLAIGLFAVSFQSVKAALANPVKALKCA